ncbi:AgmX/PglI C-terminal domain-containing protein [Pendulispora albinea]|uniref:AgmX/PglI C-terminal domain-containing protein n=1 Tax=Pendulispora albinea TaxID=2741071 RepID=A0ABZ2LJ65_9BACT
MSQTHSGSGMGPGQQPGQQPGQAGQNRPGQMTAVMRAVAQQAGPKVLRIGLVQGGRVIEERIIKQRTSVTVGTSEKSMFVIPSQSVPASFKLFELIGSDYYLNFLDGMKGRVALQTGISDIEGLRGQARKVGNAYQVRLTEEARGKIVVGETTFLFQFVAPPPPQPRPQLPLSVKGGLASQIDWDLTIIAAFSFLLHFGLIGAMYSDWMDPPVNEDINIQSLIDPLKSLPATPTETPPETATSPEAKATAPTKESGATKTSGGGPKGAVSDKAAAALSQQADAMQMQMLAAFGGNSAVQGALNRSDIPPADLSGVASSGAGVSNTGGDLRLGSGGGGVVQPGKAGGGLAGIGNSGGGGVGAGAGKETAVKGPTGDAQIGATTASVPVSNAERVVAGLRPKFRACYNKGLASDPGMAGGVTIVTKVAPNGEVTAADGSNVSGLSPDVVSCIQRVVRNAQFDAPGGSGSTINIPVKFVQQGK